MGNEMKRKLLLVCLLVFAILALSRRVLAAGYWGDIANSNHQNEKIISALFFAGPPDPNALSQTQSILAINPFNITSQGASGQPESTISEGDRLAYAESVVKKWSSSHLPFITPLLPGYDAHLVFPSLGRYGFTGSWLNNQKSKLLFYPHKGVSFDVWNGYTEGYTIVPTTEDGDRIYVWAKDIIALENIQLLSGDLNRDGKIDIFDYNLLIQNFGNTTCNNVADIDGNVINHQKM